MTLYFQATEAGAGFHVSKGSLQVLHDDRLAVGAFSHGNPLE